MVYNGERFILVCIEGKPEVLGSIPGASRFSEKQRVWNGVYSAL
jgi:hypothetical protein